EPAAPLKTPLPSADTPATARTDESPAASSPGKPSSESSSDKPADDAAKNAEPAEEPFDPIKENGPIFVDWPKPRLAIVITGREDGYLEPCGCAGLEKMKGGLSRRHTMIKGLIAKGWPVVRVDAGGLTKGYGRQTEIKFQITVEAMRKIGYDAIGFGANDLRLPAAELVSVAADPASPFVSANVGLFELESGLTARTKIAEAGGLKIGVTAVLGTKYQSEINNQEIQFSPPEEAIAKVLPELKKTCNLLILLAHATREESIALGKRFRDFQLVVTSDSPAEPPAEATRIPGTDSLLIEVGEKGMNAVVVGLYNDPQKPLRYQRVPLDSRFAASKDMYRLMVAYQEQLKRQGLEGLGVRAIDHPQAELNGPFVGSEKCKSCHEESYRIWKKSGHAKGWKTLVELDPPRNFDPECISCHVVGWHPTRYFPYKTGFLSEKQTPEMVNIGCETCHGPGGAHCDAEDGSDLALQEKLQIAVRVTKEESQTNLSKMCQNCHDLDNSPAFKFETYWPKVEHYEEE
ncbi:MAG TPA: multiheme c-type cytochrome, partial [Thermoguttaceae bacterium]|nr:multiheme c-type cytochrome [Thermoguttaceae bacterium]